MSAKILFYLPAIEANVPEGSGIYVIRGIRDKVIYVGKATNLCERLIQHVQGQSKQADCLRRHEASNVRYELCPKAALKQREGYAIGFHDPVCNQTRR